MVTRSLQRAAWRPCLAGLATLLVPFVTAYADPLSITRWTTDSGGSGFVQTGLYTLGGTIGQPDAGLLINGSFLLTGGFWGPGAGATTGVDPDPEPNPGTDGDPVLALRIYPPAPNPLTDRTLVAFDLPAPLDVAIEVFDVTGAQVRVLADGAWPAGRHALRWDAADAQGRRVRAGLYWVRVRLGTLTRTQKMVVMR
jgi:FlgD Ig-like domain